MSTIYDWQGMFGDMGKIVKIADNLDSFIQTLEARQLEVRGHFASDIYDVEYLNSLLTTLSGFGSSLAGNVSTVAGDFSSYITSLLARKIKSGYQTADAIILHLIDRMNEGTGYDEAGGQTIEGNLVTLLPEWDELGDSGEQLSGYAGMRGLSNAVTDSENKIYLEIIDSGGGNGYVNIYKDSARGVGDLIGHTAVYSTTGLVVVSPDGSSGLRGTLTIDTVPAAASVITITFTFDGERTGTGSVSAWIATQMAVTDDITIDCLNADVEGSETWRVYSRVRGLIAGTSGLVTTAVAYPGTTQDKAGFELTISAGGTAFAAGDRFELSLVADDGALFQRFFRDHFTRTLPYKLDGTETISDALAQ